jgi:murein DD-endopeptidase MepM/ murein hydrolase activator NlpD
MKNLFITLLIFLSLLTCHKTESLNSPQTDAQYVLPFPVGKAYQCMQGFNGPYSHRGNFYYSVDFTMNEGTLITASRKGRVDLIIQNYLDSDYTEGHENVVIVQHDDSTFARYAHLKFNGAVVSVGQNINPGDAIGYSGSTGSSIAHLHFDVTKGTNDRWNAKTIPFSFKNNFPVDAELKMGVTYTARPY